MFTEAESHYRARACQTQRVLMDQYPEHTFGLSAALHYFWLEEDHPALLAQVKQRVAEGRWEVQGAMWVEADGNMPSGESLVRQFLHGARWLRERFGTVSDFLWLPDVFGYPASLPQIMRHCGADALVTQKISWSQFNKFPHNAFRWHGIDGTEVFAYFPPENNYSGSVFPADLRAAQERCAERDRLDTMLSLFGYGDGGGGPHAKHIERARRCANLEGCPPVQFSTAGRFLDTLRTRREVLDSWHGPFYLELHRGTFSTHAFVKWANRRLEELPHAWSDPVQLPSPLPADSQLLDTSGTFVAVQGILAAIQVPPLSFATYRILPGAPRPAPLTIAPAVGTLRVLENAFIRYEFDADARLINAYDKILHRELIPISEPANTFSLYDDHPTSWEAWDIDINYEQELIAIARATAPSTFETASVRTALQFHLAVGHSDIHQTIALRPYSRRLDFETDGLEFTEGARTTVANEVELAFAPFQIRTWKISIEMCPNSHHF